jgi:ribosome biogenesis GTPase A
MPNFWEVINKVIKEADVLIEVVDARMISETRNIELESKIKKTGKPLIYVINKCDLANQKMLEQEKRKLQPSVFVSAKEKLGFRKLRELVMSKSGSNKEIAVGVIGYPNTGKSSIINALSGGGKVRTSSQSGFTKGQQNIRISKKMRIIDTPGVVPYKEKDDIKHGMTSTIDYAHVKDPDLVVMELMQRFPGKIEKHYSIEVMDELEDALQNIAIKFNKVRKGGEPDINSVSRLILKHWQEGKIR